MEIKSEAARNQPGQKKPDAKERPTVYINYNKNQQYKISKDQNLSQTS